MSSTTLFNSVFINALIDNRCDWSAGFCDHWPNSMKIMSLKLEIRVPFY